MKREIVNPESLGAPRGYSNGVLVRGGGILFVAGQIGWDESQRIVEGGFVAQFDRALANVLTVVEAAGGTPESVVRMTVFVADKSEYCDALAAVGASWRARMGRNYPAMSLVEVSALLEPGALVEIEATAAIE